MNSAAWPAKKATIPPPSLLHPHGRYYRAVYGEHHYLLATALSNLASVYAAEKRWPRAEKLFRQAVALYTETQSEYHVNTGIAPAKIGQ